MGTFVIQWYAKKLPGILKFSSTGAKVETWNNRRFLCLNFWWRLLRYCTSEEFNKRELCVNEVAKLSFLTYTSAPTMVCFRGVFWRGISFQVLYISFSPSCWEDSKVTKSPFVFSQAWKWRPDFSSAITLHGFSILIGLLRNTTS